MASHRTSGRPNPVATGAIGGGDLVSQDGWLPTSSQATFPSAAAHSRTAAPQLQATMKKTIAMHEERDKKHKADDGQQGSAVPAYLLEREQVG